MCVYVLCVLELDLNQSNNPNLNVGLRVFFLLLFSVTNECVAETKRSESVEWRMVTLLDGSAQSQDRTLECSVKGSIEVDEGVWANNGNWNREVGWIGGMGLNLGDYST